MARMLFIAAACIFAFAASVLAGPVQAAMADSDGVLANIGRQAGDIVGHACKKQAGQTENAAPYSSHGQLATSGASVVDANGAPFQIRGISTHGIAWFSQYVNEDAFATWKSWGANTVRLACYTSEYGGWCSGGDHSQLLATIDAGVQAATRQDMYVIIDWHILSDGNLLSHLDEAKSFFQTVSTRYAGHGTVIYEICNEPNGATSWDDVYSYATQVIPVIRANAPNALIVCGSPTWSQDVDLAAQKPLPFANVAYSLHFYAATHKEDLRDKARTALRAGLPLLVSEFGISNASGDGALDEASGNQWVSFLDSQSTGFVCWSLSNKAESSALLSSSSNTTSGWTDSELSQEGHWYKAVLLAHAGGQAATSMPDTEHNSNSGAGTDNDASGASVAGLCITAQKSTTWNSGASAFAQIDATVADNGSATSSVWTASLQFDRDVQISQSWNGTFSVSGSTVTVTPDAEWQRAIAAGSNANFGCIVSSSDGSPSLVWTSIS